MRPRLLRLLRPVFPSFGHARGPIPLVARAASHTADQVDAAARLVVRGAELARLLRPPGSAFTLWDDVAHRVLQTTGGSFFNVYDRSFRQTETLLRITGLVRRTENPIVIFDLDDTLFSTLPRHVAILREYGRRVHMPQMALAGPEHVTSWDLNVVFRNLEIDDLTAQSHLRRYREFWERRFFSNEYLRYDLPPPGAAAYVRRLRQLGAEIVYLTGRVERSWPGTVAALRRHRFPTPTLSGKGVNLMMKPSRFAEGIDFSMPERTLISASRVSDVRFKEEAIGRIRKRGEVVAAFDNEPANINLLFNRLIRGNGGYAVHFETAWALDEPLDSGIVVIRGFLL